jgi:hypothetical protein
MAVIVGREVEMDIGNTIGKPGKYRACTARSSTGMNGLWGQNLTPVAFHKYVPIAAVPGAQPSDAERLVARWPPSAFHAKRSPNWIPRGDLAVFQRQETYSSRRDPINTRRVLSRWRIAYGSLESGLNEVYVRQFVEVAGRRQVSAAPAAGHSVPRWASPLHFHFVLQRSLLALIARFGGRGTTPILR